MSTFKILSWNIRQGGGTRVAQIVNAISRHAPHLAILSEYRNNARGDTLKKALAKNGFVKFLTTAAPPQLNSVLVASKADLIEVSTSATDPDFPYAVVQARLPAFDILGMHLPHKKKHSWFEIFLDQLQVSPPTILAGDFNSGKNGIDQRGNSFWYEGKLIALEQLGYVDAFRYVHGSRTEYSWFSHQGNGYRYDHTYVHPAIVNLIGDCYYSQTEREAGISDHAVMMLELTAAAS